MLSPTIQLRDFSPDLDPATPGILTDCDNLFGTTRGLRTLGSFVAVSGVLPGSPAVGTYAAIFISGDRLIVTGTATDLYFLSEGGALPAWTLASRGGVTGAYAPGTRWSYAMWGNFLIATNGVAPVQVSKNGTTFTDLGGNPPLASIVEVTAYNYVFLVKPRSNEWIASPFAETWALTTDNIALGTTSAKLDATPGSITALHRLRDGIVAFKQRSLYMGNFLGPPYWWGFRGVSDQVGCANQQAVIEADDVLYFLGPDDFWRFDGSSLSRVPNNLKEWFFRELDPHHIDGVLASFDRLNDLIFWYYSTNGSGGVLNGWVALNIRTGKWTKGSMVVEDLVLGGYISENELTYAEFEDDPASGIPFTTVPPAYNDAALNSLTYGSDAIEEIGMSVFAVVVDGVLGEMTGAPTFASLTTGELTDGSTILLVRELRPIFAVAPADTTLATTLRPAKRMINGAVAAYGPQVVMNTAQGTFYLTRTARSHQFKLDVQQLVEIVGLKVDTQPVGIH